ncbi:hypothetical protein LCGC14_0809720 [marine sediment metagenome]|uniref:NAD-dependent epimerase/dehydratase domain-containing protein n=1 Tax=marine sediment metagenome TaxID=412755 RepID=A0A0F9PRP2_9ZZZZ
MQHSGHDYNYMLVGATGQIGRYLLELLPQMGRTVVLIRRKSLQDARWDLPAGEFDIVLGGLSSSNLPTACHVINAAGFTKLVSHNIHKYIGSNVIGATNLAHHVAETGGILHQLSSVAVAEFRKDVLTEANTPMVVGKQLPYSLSKALMENAISAILPPEQLQILRLGDVVPPVSAFSADWRRDHWLPVLFSCGKPGLSHAPPDYHVWVSDVSELAKAVCLLLDSPMSMCHVLGKMYSFEQFKRNAMDVPAEENRDRLSKWMTHIITYGPEAHMVTDYSTMDELHLRGFEWTTLEDPYWIAFALRSREPRRQQ